MDIGASIFLIVLGAIFAFAVKFDFPGVDIQVIGWILILAGVVGMAVTFLYWRPRRRRTTGGTVVQERIYADDPGQPPPPM